MAELYTLYNGDKPVAYAYGDPWVAQALFMDDIKFKTPEEAKDWWEKNYGASSAPHYLDALKMRKEDEEKVMIQTNIFDEVEVHENCTVQILRNSVTGETSIGWWENDDA